MDESDQITRWPSIDAGSELYHQSLAANKRTSVIAGCDFLRRCCMSVNSPFEDPLITTSHRVKLIKRIASIRARLLIVSSEISMEKTRTSANSCLFLYAKCYEVVGKLN